MFEENENLVEESTENVEQTTEEFAEVEETDETDSVEEQPTEAIETFTKEQVDEMIAKTPAEFQSAMIEKDNLDAAIAAHWGPNAFGYIFVEKE